MKTISLFATTSAFLSLPLFSSVEFAAVKDIFEHSCVECHNADKSKGGLRMDLKDEFMKGGESADAIDLKAPDESEILRRVALAHDDDEFMPPSDKKVERPPLSVEEIGQLKTWIEAGAPWPDGPALEQRERTGPLEDPMLADADLESIAVYPNSVTLETRRDFHRLIILATDKNSVTRDITASALLSIADPAISKLEGTTLFPVVDGETSVKIEFRGKELTVPVTVKGAKEGRRISFQQDVVPIFTASGCNTGSCHGSARGQDGFMISIFGYDPKGDHFRLTRELAGRRLNLAIPEDSLMLTKSTGEVPHTGGKLFDEKHPFYATLLEWVRDGANYDPEDISLPVKVEIEPKQFLLEGEGKKIPLTVKATYSDGTDRDVTTLSNFTTSNDNSVSIDRSTGLSTSKSRGEAFVMARFHTFTEGSQAIVIPEGLDYTRPELPEFNYIDKHVYAKLHKLRVIPSEVCADDIFARRVYIDIVGLLPSEAELHEFLADPNPRKREALVDRLLERKDFTELWVMKWAELLQIRTTGANSADVTYKSALLWYEWLRGEIAANHPLNEIVYDLLSATGGSYDSPATNFFKAETDIKKLTENVAQIFMGTRIQCAQCHNHPFDRWTMDDYYGFASFFTQVRRKPGEDPTEQIIFDGGGDINHPVTNQTAPPTYLGDGLADTKDMTRREAVAAWLTKPGNPWFAKNSANIIWSHFFGIGIVDPVDDVRISNPATNPELLADLGKKFTEYNFDMKKLVRDICTSRTYQLSTQTNATNEADLTNFSHSLIRRMRAEVLLDTLAQVTETPNKFKGLPIGSRAVNIADGNTSTYFLTTFGRATRATVCSCEVKMEPNLSQALHLLNGDAVSNRITQGKVVQTMLDDKKSPEEIVKNLYLRSLSREPNDAETSKLNNTLAAAKDPDETRMILEDIFWALLNSKEYLFNH